MATKHDFNRALEVKASGTDYDKIPDRSTGKATYIPVVIDEAGRHSSQRFQFTKASLALEFATAYREEILEAEIVDNQESAKAKQDKQSSVDAAVLASVGG